jgi:hypothetical protein
MNIPRFWAKAEKSVTIANQAYHFVAWKGSDSSLNDAQRLAEEALAERITRKERGEKLGQYPKDGVPLREEMIEDIKDSRNERIAAITRNAAGCLVLNTARVMFIDLDIVNAPYLHGTLRGCLASLFTGWLRRLSPAETRSDEEKVLEHIRTWHSNHPEWAMRVYKTKRGFRLLVTHALFNPRDANVTQVMQELGADKRYMLLCGAQSCFRARLTPKPWRIKLQKPSTRYPWETPEQELLQREWEEHYHQVIKHYSVCTFVETLGSSNVHLEAEQILRIHDSYVLDASNKPLA